VTQTQLIVAVIDALNEAHVPYLLAGSLAANIYSIPRSTKDADFVVEMDAAALDKITTLLEPLFELDPQQHLETTTWTRRYIWKAREIPFDVELFLKSSDPHHTEQWSRRREIFIEALNRKTWVPTPEDITIQKLRWGRTKDLTDAAAMLSVRGKLLDWPYIEKWCSIHGSLPRLDAVKAAIPSDLLA
jgi:hypothetical protein